MPNTSVRNDIRYDQALYTRELQIFLRELAFHDNRIPLINVDGVYGPETSSSVSAVQTIYGLPVTGDVDRLTWETVVAVYRILVRQRLGPGGISPFPSPVTLIQEGDEGDIVMILQLMLVALSRRFVNIPMVGTRGHMDMATVNAVKAFQKIFGLPVTGQVDMATWNQLATAYNRYGIW